MNKQTISLHLKPEMLAYIYDRCDEQNRTPSYILNDIARKHVGIPLRIVERINDNRQITFSFDIDVVDALRRQAGMRRMTLTSYVRELLEDFKPEGEL